MRQLDALGTLPRITDACAPALPGRLLVLPEMLRDSSNIQFFPRKIYGFLFFQNSFIISWHIDATGSKVTDSSFPLRCYLLQQVFIRQTFSSRLLFPSIPSSPARGTPFVSIRSRTNNALERKYHFVRIRDWQLLRLCVVFFFPFLSHAEIPRQTTLSFSYLVPVSSEIQPNNERLWEEFHARINNARFNQESIYRLALFSLLFSLPLSPRQPQAMLFFPSSL